jgi:hypothetical protein
MNEQTPSPREDTSDSRVEQTILHLFEAWATTDPEARLALLERCWTDDGVYQDPQNRSEGRAGLSEIIAGFHAGRPGARIPLASGVDHHHGMLRFRWIMLGPDGAALTEGFDIGELAEDGRLRRITGFFGPFPALPAHWPDHIGHRG